MTHTKDEALKLALDAQQIIASLCADKVIDSKEEKILRAATKQVLAAPVQEPVNGDKVNQLVSKCTHRDVDGNWYVDGVQLVHETCFALNAIKRKSATPPAPASVPDFKSFKEWAAGEGYDVAYTHDGIKWVCLNPITADLWCAWQAAHGITEKDD